MVMLNKKNKVVMTAIVAFAIIMVIAIPFASAQTTANGAIANIKTLKSPRLSIPNN